MIHVVWEFRAREGMRAEFESRYSSSGSWALLFRRAAGFEGTTLMRDATEPGRYLVIDAWRDAASLAAFKQAYGPQYARLDAECEALTEDEIYIGTFEVLP